MATIVFFSTIGVVLLGCTICDFVTRKSPEASSATVDTVAKFSLYRNALAELNTKSDAYSMPAIHGLRCLCCCTIVFAHRWLLLFFLFHRQFFLLDIVKVINTPFGLCWEMAPYAVDTFCVIGGFLLAHRFFKMKRSGSEFSVFTMYLHRYLRLTPSTAVVLLFVLFLPDRFGSGPMWNAVATHASDDCRENWWITLLYLQNLISPDRMCLQHTWSLALDMQLFWFSPLILYPLYYSPKLGLRILSFLIVVAAVSKLTNNCLFYYQSTHNRACPYLVGILLGYDVATRKRHLTETNVAINWTVAGLLILFCTWLTNFLYNSGFVGDWLVEIPAALVLRPSWSIAVAWVLYACTQGYGGWVTRFLSLPIFVPLSRLSYCIYSVHMVIQVMKISSFYGSIDPSPMSHMVNGVIGDLVLSTAAAFVLHVSIECPSIILTKILLDNRNREPEVVTLIGKNFNDNSDLAMEQKSKSQ